MKLIALTVTTMALGLAVGLAADTKVDPSKLPPASTQKGVTYAKYIQPLFEKTCFKCHGQEKQKGKLRLDSLEAALKGGENGKDVIAGKSAESPLVHAIAHLGDEDYFMPPPKNKDNIKQLGKEEIGLIRAWIDQGAK